MIYPNPDFIDDLHKSVAPAPLRESHLDFVCCEASGIE